MKFINIWYKTEFKYIKIEMYSIFTSISGLFNKISTAFGFLFSTAICNGAL